MVWLLMSFKNILCCRRKYVVRVIGEIFWVNSLLAKSDKTSVLSIDGTSC